jgi:hypothetical protein
MVEERVANASSPVNHIIEAGMERNDTPSEPMPVEPLIAQLTAQKFQPEPPRPNLSASRNEFYTPEPVHGERTPVPVSGPSFLGLSDSNDRGVEYLLEDEPHSGRKRTVLVLLLLLIAAGAWLLHWRKTGSPSLFQSSAQLGSSSSSSQNTATMPSEVAPPMANDQKLDKPMTGVGDHPLTDDSAKTGDGSKSESTAPPKAAPTSDALETKESGKSSSEAASAEVERPDSATKSAANDAEATEAPPTAPGKAIRSANRMNRTSAPAAVTPAAPNPATDSRYLEGQKYLYGSGGVRQNCALARQNLLASASSDNSKAESTLGTMYATGHCAPRDIPLAYRWFARALRSDPQNVRLERDAEILWNQMTPPERQVALKSQ